MKTITTMAAVLALFACACLACPPTASASGARGPAVPPGSNLYAVQFSNSRGDVLLRATVVADTGMVANFEAVKSVPYVWRVSSDRPLTPASLASVKTGVWGSLLPAANDQVAVSVQTAVLDSVHTLRSASVSSQPIQLPRVTGTRLSLTVQLAPGARVRIPLGLHGEDGVLVVVRGAVGGR